MNAPTTIAARTFRPQLLERRARLQAARTSVSAEYLSDLLAEIDSALGRIDDGSFGVCESATIRSNRTGSQPIRWSGSVWIISAGKS